MGVPIVMTYAAAAALRFRPLSPYEYRLIAALHHITSRSRAAVISTRKPKVAPISTGYQTAFRELHRHHRPCA